MKLLFFDLEISAQGDIVSIGAVDQHENLIYKGHSTDDFLVSTRDFDVIAGHNIIQFDLERGNLHPSFVQKATIDTLRLSSLIFIRKPYHHLKKLYKQTDDYFDSFRESNTPGNNPVQDAKLSLALFQECVDGFLDIPSTEQQILFTLLGNTRQFKIFFSYLIENKLFAPRSINVATIIQQELVNILRPDFFGDPLINILKNDPIAFAYIFRLLYLKKHIDKDISVFPARVNHTIPNLSKIFSKIFVYKEYNLKSELKKFFGFDSFRDYENSHGPRISQQEIIQSGMEGKDILAILATGGGKSICFQLPALITAEWSGYLTLVISPLQSLMEDQVYELQNKYHRPNVGFLNSAQDPLTRKEVCEKVENGGIDLLYLSPEMLRSSSTQSLLSKRLIARIVIDEAHCFSKRGHDFRTDYMFIADFIKELAKINKSLEHVNISCFTATAKQEVKEEILKYFKDHFNKNLEVFRSTVKRDNLHYKAYQIDVGENESVEEKKFAKLVEILETQVQGQPCVIFTRNTGRAKTIGAQNLSENLNERLIQDGYGDCRSAYYHGRLQVAEKQKMMADFIEGRLSTIVATKAFGMGVNKSDVRYVIHYDMPNSVEDYLQEAGRAGRDGDYSECIVLYHHNDLDENLRLNKQGEVREKEIKQLRKSLKRRLEKSVNFPKEVTKSARQLIEDAGWSKNFSEESEDQRRNLEVKLKTALYFLEKPGSEFIKRLLNKTRIWATSKKSKSAIHVYAALDALPELTLDEKEKIKLIYQEIITGKTLSIEELPDKIGLRLKDQKDENGNYHKGVESLVKLLHSYEFIDMADEITLYVNPLHKQTSFDRINEIGMFFAVMKELLGSFDLGSEIYRNKSKLNSDISRKLGKDSIISEMNSFFSLLQSNNQVSMTTETLLFYKSTNDIFKQMEQCLLDGQKLIELLLSESASTDQAKHKRVSIVKRLKQLAPELGTTTHRFISLIELEKLLKFLHLFDIIDIESGLFLYLTQYKLQTGEHFDGNFLNNHADDIRLFYQNKTQQAHIMNELVLMIARGQNTDNFVDDYFNLDYESVFLPLYFKFRLGEISRPLSKSKQEQIYGGLSDTQQMILKSKGNLLINAGPGAGKTKSLVHKVASLILEDGVRSEDFLLLSFSRSAKYELKERIIKLVGASGYFLEINTFHGYAYKLLGRNPAEQDFDSKNGKNIVTQAITYLEERPDLQLPFTTIMLDEFQDINDEQFKFVQLLAERSSVGDDRLKIIATGDDDQCIYEFQGGNIKYIQDFKNTYEAESAILDTNYRSTQELIDFADSFISQVPNRLKVGKRLISGRKTDLFSLKSRIETWDCNGNYLLGIEDVVKSMMTTPGTTAILCHNNETVLQLSVILKKLGIPVKLLLKESGYQLSDTVEIDDFLNRCKPDPDGKNGVNKDNIKEKFNSVLDVYGDNKNTKMLGKIIQQLVDINSKIKFETIQEYIVGLNEDDFNENDSQVFISTFHRAKGREFDNVIICFDPEKDRQKNTRETNNAMNRLIYVGLTRAKNNLIVLGNAKTNPYFDILHTHSPDKKTLSYPNEPLAEIALITSCKDVFLSFSPWATTRSMVTISGQVEYRLSGEHIDFILNGTIIQKSSKAFKTRLNDYVDRGYAIKSIELYQRLKYPTKDGEFLVYLFKLSLTR